MIPKLFTKDAETFETNGLGRLSDAVSCIVTEQLNGEYSLTMKYPTTGRHYDELEPGLIIYADNDTTNNPQAFRIATIDANATDGTAEIYAPHISYDLSRVVVMPFTANNVAAAIRAIGTNAANYCPFTFDTDKSVSSTYTLHEPHSARAMLGGETNSLLDVYGKGEYEFDNFDVYLHLNRGSDSGVTLRYGKNITELKKEVDTQGTFNGAVGFWKDATSGETVTGNIVKSEYWNDDDQQTQTLGALDFSQTWQEKPTVAQIDNRATAYITENEPWAPKVNLNVSFVDLAQTEEFADIAPLMRLKVADRLTIYFPALGVNSTAKIVKAEYNVLADRFERLEVGNHRNSLAGVLKTGFATTDAVTQQLTDLASVLKDAQDNATALITGAQGGHVLIHTDDAGKPFEILIMDTESITTATKVWRWNVNGWGYSGTGYAGQYTTAATMDGAIVADSITAGTLSAIRIQSADGSSYWNLPTSDFVIGTSDGYTKSTIRDGVIKAENTDTLRSATLLDGYVRTYYNGVKGTQLYSSSTANNIICYHCNDGENPHAGVTMQTSTSNDGANLYIRNKSGSVAARLANNVAGGGYLSTRIQYTNTSSESASGDAAVIGADNAGGYISLNSVNNNRIVNTFYAEAEAGGTNIYVRRAVNGSYKNNVEITTGTSGGAVTVDNLNGYKKASIGVDPQQDCGIITTRNNGQTVVNMLSCANNGGQFIQYNTTGTITSALYSNENYNGIFQLMDADGAAGFQVAFDDYGNCLMGIRKGTGSGATWKWY